MNIGIIGAGNIGGTLVRKLSALGHKVKVANSRGPATLALLATETGAEAVELADAVKDVELVVVTIPQKNVPGLPKNLFASVPADVIVVDTGNYYPARDGQLEGLEAGKTESAWVAGVIGRPVLKVFNNIMTHSLANGSRPKGDAERIALPVAGDDAGAKGRVLALVDELGFDGVDAGTLEESWRQEPGTPVYCTDLGADLAKKALAAADRTTAPVNRDALMARFGSLSAAPSPSDIIALAREVHGADSL
jgi:8-hydroxy-5-deazaflavin:NADPH oxidoreductase